MRINTIMVVHIELGYSKRFESIDGKSLLQGYRFSDRHFMSMDQYLDRRYRYGAQENNKELYTLTPSKQFPQWDLVPIYKL